MPFQSFLTWRQTVKKRREDFDDAVPEGAAEAAEAEEEPDLLASMLEGVMNMDNEHEEDLGGAPRLPDIDSDGNDEEDPIETCASHSSESSEDQAHHEDEQLPEQLPADVARAVKESARQHRERLLDARRSNEKAAGKPLLKQVISLISFHGEVFFVIWTRPELMKARRVSLDHKFRIKALVAFVVPEPRHWSCYVESKGAGRADMPVWCLRLLRERQVQGFAGPMPEDSPYGPCIVCAALSTEPDAGSGHLLVCGTCLAPWHVKCASRLPFDGMEIAPPTVRPACARLD